MAFLVCLPIAGAIATFFDKKIEEAIPVAMFIATFVTYICGISGFLTISPIVVGAIAVGALGYCLAKVIKKHSVKNIFSIGGVSYVVFGIYYAFVTRGRMVAEQDDLQVYGKYVADFYHMGKIIRFDYMPGMMMWEYLSERFWRVFSDGILFLAVAMICVGMLLAIFSIRERRHWCYYLFVGLFIVLLPLSSNIREFYFVLQNDFVMGVVMAYIVCMYLKARKYKDTFYECAVLFGLAFLTLTKATGLIISAIILLIIIGMDVVADEKRLSFESMVFVIKGAISIMIARLSWLFFAKSSGSAEKYSHFAVLLWGYIRPKWYLMVGTVVLIAFGVLVFKWIADNQKFALYVGFLIAGSAILGFYACFRNTADIRKDAIVNFLNVIFSTYAPSRSFGFGYRFYVPYAMLFVILIFVWKIVSTVGTDMNADIIGHSNKLLILVNVGFVLFAVSVFFSSVYTRNPSQVARAKECERYLYAYVTAYLIIYVYQIASTNVQNYNLHRVVIFFASVMLLLLANTSGVVTKIFASDNYYNFDGLNYVDINENDVFFYVDQKGELDYSRFNYRISPATMINYYFSDMMVDGFWLGNDEADRYMTSEEWNEILRSCSYVYVAATNGNFEEMYGDFFADKIINGYIYYVDKRNDSIKLRTIDY